MNNYKNFKDTQQTDAWLRSKGINVQTFAKTKSLTLQAQQAATLLLEQHSTELDNATKRLLDYFRRCYADNNKRGKITDGDCYRVLNLATRVKRGEYKRNRRQRQTASPRERIDVNIDIAADNVNRLAVVNPDA